MRIGILGAGQLGRMLALAGYPLGHSFIFFDQSPGESTAGIGKTHVGSFDDTEALARFARECDVITYEFENVPFEAATFLETKAPVYPPPRALEVSQDRLIEKSFFRSLDIITPRFHPAASLEELQEACSKVGLPCIAKTRRFGYDGKGQAGIEQTSSIPDVWRSLGGAPLVVESMVPFSRELSIIAVRDQRGTISTYPLAQNEHRAGILHKTIMPALNTSHSLEEAAHSLVTKIMQELRYVGVVAIELFELDGSLVANEMAPRVHNSGHATIDCVTTSQFENHIRAISGMPLGPTTSKAQAVMLNLVVSMPSMEKLLAISNAKVHVYGKSPRAGRKLGHVTLLNPSDANITDLERIIINPPL